MSRIEISQDIAAPADQAWMHLADLASHPMWMKDALSIEFASETTRGTGTTMIVPTRVGPFRTRDVIEVTGWVEGQSIRVDHKGLISGSGEFTIQGHANRSTVTWRERLHFPWWLGGGMTGWLASPILKHIWKGNLERFAGLVESAMESR